MTFNQCTDLELHTIDSRLQNLKFRVKQLADKPRLTRDDQKRFDDFLLAICEIQNAVILKIKSRLGDSKDE